MTRSTSCHGRCELWYDYDGHGPTRRRFTAGLGPCSHPLLEYCHAWRTSWFGFCRHGLAIGWMMVVLGSFARLGFCSYAPAIGRVMASAVHGLVFASWSGQRSGHGWPWVLFAKGFWHPWPAHRSVHRWRRSLLFKLLFFRTFNPNFTSTSTPSP